MIHLFDEDPPDRALDEVADAIIALDPDGRRWAEVIRHTYDMIYNGAETGRFRWPQLMKTEKTHFGTLFEINAQREFAFEGGEETDYRIVGHQVDAKWSQEDGRWMMPPEVIGELALVATASDFKAQFSLGLVRVLPEYRREGKNRDKKSELNPTGRAALRWLFRDAPMPENVLLRLPPGVIEKIFDSRSGTERVSRLFRATQGRLVYRSAVQTVAMQLDGQKRVRANGGARSVLKPEGIIILGGYHAQLAAALGVPVPDSKHYISVRVVPGGEDDPIISGTRWRKAMSGDPVVEASQLSERGAQER